MADKKKFSLAEQIGAAVGSTSIAAMDANAKIAADVSKSDREHIVYLPRTALVADEKNFYSMDGIEELARNIETVGLLEPLRVRQIEGEDGLYRFVSGHRRRAALDWLALHGNDLGDVACIVEKTDGVSLAMQELRLIYANSDTRKMTDADIAKQAERVEVLLKELKAEGYELKGRVRDHVAELCGTSQTKIANLHLISKNLIPEFKELWADEKINTSKAMRLAQSPREVQQRISDCYANYTLEEATEAEIDGLCRQAQAEVEEARKIADVQSPKPDAPQPADNFDAKSYIRERESEDALLDKAVRDFILDEFCEALRACQTRQGGIAMLKDEFKHAAHWGGDIDWDGSPKGLEFRLPHEKKVFRTWTEVWDALAVVALRERGEGKTKVPTPAKRSDAEAAPQWRTGTPPKNGWYWTMILDGEDGDALYYRSGMWYFSEHGTQCGGIVTHWYPLPKARGDEE